MEMQLLRRNAPLHSQSGEWKGMMRETIKGLDLPFPSPFLAILSLYLSILRHSPDARESERGKRDAALTASRDASRARLSSVGAAAAVSTLLTRFPSFSIRTERERERLRNACGSRSAWPDEWQQVQDIRHTHAHTRE